MRLKVKPCPPADDRHVSKRTSTQPIANLSGTDRFTNRHVSRDINFGHMIENESQ
ncbi:MAG: hypothetical protein NPIRA02_34680 [Nitrospirales bacterium]|nr:MAG: hypothetical protein NPIRA02_34680 [Nitrospirales bacterium]